MYVAILGRQPHLGMAELEHLYGASRTQWFSRQTALITPKISSIERLGGTQKAGRITLTFSRNDWQHVSTKIVQTYTEKWTHHTNKLTLGISVYGIDISARDVQKVGIILKQKLKHAGVSVRLIPNSDPALNTAASHHNKLGLSDSKVELLVVRGTDGSVIVAESIGTQNITAYAKRDQERPKRDAFVGMLPPKLAQIMINLATVIQVKAKEQASAQLQSSRSPFETDKYLQPERHPTPGPDMTPGAKPFVRLKGRKGEQSEVQNHRILDPFCGTGVILQEAALMGYAVYGTDLSDKMIDYTHTNLEWLETKYHITPDILLHQGDAMNTTWQPPIDVVVGESYLGQPFSAPPSPPKLNQVKRNCEYIISSFLKNIAPQLRSGTPLVLAIPAWRDSKGHVTHLSLTKHLQTFGFMPYRFAHVAPTDLLYYREDQVVARELLVLTKT